MLVFNNRYLMKLAEIFVDSGYEIRVVGGAVRDLCLGLKPKDIDLCTNATPDEMMALAEQHGLYVIPTGLQHGTVTFMMGGEPFEVTTLRVDVETDGRHAKVEYTRDFQLDAERRDFTMNAMSMDINGHIYDYFEGRDHLKRGVIMFVGDPNERVREDYLRVWRYVRFFAKTAVSEAPQSIYQLFNMPWVHEGMRGLSGERIWAELKKILTAPHAGDALRLVFGTKLMETLGNGETINGPEYRRVGHTILMAMKRFEDRLRCHPVMVEALVMAVLVCNIDPKSYEIVAERLKFSSSERRAYDYMIKIISFYMTCPFDSVEAIQSHFYLNTTNGSDPQLEAAAVMVAEHITQANIISTIAFKMLDQDNQVIYNSTFDRFTITGKDLMARGVKPGPQMGQILRFFKTRWAQGHHPCEEMLAHFDKVFPDKSQLYVWEVSHYTWSKYEQDRYAYWHNMHEMMQIAMDRLEPIVAKSVEAGNDFMMAHANLGPNVDYATLFLYKDKATAMLRKLEHDAA